MKRRIELSFQDVFNEFLDREVNFFLYIEIERKRRTIRKMIIRRKFSYRCGRETTSITKTTTTSKIKKKYLSFPWNGMKCGSMSARGRRTQLHKKVFVEQCEMKISAHIAQNSCTTNQIKCTDKMVGQLEWTTSVGFFFLLQFLCFLFSLVKKMNTSMIKCLHRFMRLCVCYRSLQSENCNTYTEMDRCGKT